MKMFEITLGGYKYENCVIGCAEYSDGSRALWIDDGVTGEGIADITVNMYPAMAGAGCVWLDTNNAPGLAVALTGLGLGTLTGRRACSGFAMYPEFRINEAALREFVGE